MRNRERPLPAQLDGMVDVLNKRCVAEGCRRQPSWARAEGARAIFCKVSERLFPNSARSAAASAAGAAAVGVGGAGGGADAASRAALCCCRWSKADVDACFVRRFCCRRE